VNVIEERIRAAARAAADTVPPDSVPPLELPAAARRRRPWGGRFRGGHSAGATWSSRATRLAPAAAALAVIAIAFTVAALNQTTSGSSGSSATAAGPHVPAGPPVGWYVDRGKVPPYYVQVASGDAVIRATASGAMVTTVEPSRPGGTVVAVTAAGDDRTFVLGEQGRDRKAVSFYRLRLGPAGRLGALTRLPMSVADGKTMTGLALSPDGTRIAIAIAPGGGVQQVKVYPLGGGPARTWSATGGTIGVPFATRSLSWAASQRTLAVNWTVGQTRSVRLLDLASGGGSLLAASRAAVTLGNTAGMGQALYDCGFMIMTPDGSAIACAGHMITEIARNGTIRYGTGFPEFSAVTGHVTRILGHWRYATSDGHDPSVFDLLWSDASGRLLIGVIHSADRNWVGVISGNTFSPLDARWDPAAPDFGTW
jgi:hypothetical protein